MGGFLKRNRGKIAAGTVVGLVAAFGLVRTDFNPPRYMYWVFMDRLTAGSYHKLPCRKWPTVEEAKRIMGERADVARRIENLRSEGPDVYLRTRGRCSGKAELDIYFGGISEKKKIQEIIGDDKMFFGIPYSLHNT